MAHSSSRRWPLRSPLLLLLAAAAQFLSGGTAAEEAMKVETVETCVASDPDCAAESASPPPAPSVARLADPLADRVPENPHIYTTNPSKCTGFFKMRCSTLGMRRLL